MHHIFKKRQLFNNKYKCNVKTPFVSSTFVEYSCVPGGEAAGG